MLRGLFARRSGRPNADREAAERIKTSVRAFLCLDPEDGVSVSEIACPDPACPGDETVILVMRTGQPTRAAKIGKAMTDVREQDIAAALVGESGR